MAHHNFNYLYLIISWLKGVTRLFILTTFFAFKQEKGIQGLLAKSVLNSNSMEITFSTAFYVTYNVGPLKKIVIDFI